MIKSLRSQIYHVISLQGNNITFYLGNAILLNINYVIQNTIIHQNLYNHFQRSLSQNILLVRNGLFSKKVYKTDGIFV